MHIKLRFFASLRERLGRSEDSREVPEGATVRTVWEALKHEQPALSQRLSVRSPLPSPRNTSMAIIRCTITMSWPLSHP